MYNNNYRKIFDCGNKVYVNNGAEFIVAEAGNILRMPGLGKNSTYMNMEITDDKKIRGLF